MLNRTGPSCFRDIFVVIKIDESIICVRKKDKNRTYSQEDTNGYGSWLLAIHGLSRANG